MNDLLKGTLGTMAPTLGVAVSLSSAELWLRIVSLCVGILVGLLTAYSLIRKNFYGRRD